MSGRHLLVALDKVYFGNSRKDAAKIAFDDDLIYREIALPVGRRKLVMKQMLRDEALVAFKEWTQKPDKMVY